LALVHEQDVGGYLMVEVEVGVKEVLALEFEYFPQAPAEILNNGPITDMNLIFSNGHGHYCSIQNLKMLDSNSMIKTKS
jgi:hypothetical protein